MVRERVDTWKLARRKVFKISTPLKSIHVNGGRFIAVLYNTSIVLKRKKVFVVTEVDLSYMNHKEFKENRFDHINSCRQLF